MSKIREKIRISVFDLVNHVDDEPYAEKAVDEILITVKEELIDLILQERNRCREICDDHSWWFERRIKEFHSSLKKRYEEGKEASRRIKNCISDVSPLDINNKTDIDKIKEMYEL